MNLIFNNNTLKVVAVISTPINQDGDTFIKSMFPNDFENLIVWKLNKQINHNPLLLKVVLDENKIPIKLLYKGKVIYEATQAETNDFLSNSNLYKRKEIEKQLSKSLFKSITGDLVKTWVSSKYTDKNIAITLKNWSYFLSEKMCPITWWGPYTDAGGYANMNREIVFRLHNYHIIPKIEICPTAPQVSPLSQYYISKYTSLNFSKMKNVPRVWAFTPIPHPLHSGKNIFFTMMETESLHPEFVRICNAHSNEVWVPSQHNKKVFEQYGVTKPISVMPLGIDETIYNQSNSPLGVIKPGTPFVDLIGKTHTKGIGKFRFLSLFGWSYRKGPDVLIKSFVKEFRASDDVALIIVARHSGSSAAQHVAIIRAEAERYAKSIRSNDLPQILLYPHVTPEQDMPSIFRMGNVFIHTSRGEGFSLPQIEASACGLPVISCNNTGMGEYLRDDNSYMVTTDEKEICSPEMHWITSYYHNQLFPKLGKNQIEQAQRHMRHVVNNYNAALIKGAKLRQEVFSKYTWQCASSRVAKRIKEITN